MGREEGEGGREGRGGRGGEGGEGRGEEGRGGERRGGEGRGGEGRGGEGMGREGGRGGTTVFKYQTRHVVRNNVSRCLPMAPQYLNNNHVTYYVIT